MNPGERRARGVELALLVVAGAVLYFHAVVRMAGEWSADENYSHGFLIPVVSGYLLWTRRSALRSAAADVSGSAWGLVLCLLATALMIVGVAGAEHFLQRASLVVFLLGGVWWLWGPRMLHLTAFPLLFLFFMVPLPYLVYDAVAFPLKFFAAKVATVSLQLVGVPVLREGNIIHLASQTLEVADACSGIRSLMSLISLGVVYAYFTEGVLWKRLAIVASTVPIAIVTNAFRVTGTGLLTQYVGPGAAEGFFHEFSGWLVFLAAFALLFLVGSALKLVGGRAASDSGAGGEER